MIIQTAWLDRQFAFDQPIGAFPTILERLRGTPVRARELVAGIPEYLLAARVKGKWSVKEHLGHLIDLQPLDDQRLDEFLKRAEALPAADMENRATENGKHRDVPIAEIVEKLSNGREGLVSRLGALTQDEVAIVALHPRLQKPMRLLDWTHFLAEHDDHHLALARSAIQTLHARQSTGSDEK